MTRPSSKYLRTKHAATRLDQPVGHIPVEPPDAELEELAKQALKQSNIQFGNQQAALAVSELSSSINCARDVLASETLNKVMNLRDKHLAHSLEETRREKNGPIAPMQYGDETQLLNSSIPIIEKLFNWVNGKSFSITTRNRLIMTMRRRFGTAAQSKCCANCRLAGRRGAKWPPRHKPN